MNTIVPQHIAIIMDGNGRWAKQRYLPRIAGHKAGVESVRAVVRLAVEKNIQALTLFAFSSENWQRPLPEINFLMDLFLSALQREAGKLHQQNVRIRIIGNRLQLNEKLQQQILAAEQLTGNNTGLTLQIATNYGGQWDITEAVRCLARAIEQGRLSSQDISPTLIESHLSFSDLPLPDLFIRTSGEQRISNFMLWQIAYTELYFTDVFWPDFNRVEFEKALDFYANRERRFGKTSEQMS